MITSRGIRKGLNGGDGSPCVGAGAGPRSSSSTTRPSMVLLTTPPRSRYAPLCPRQTSAVHERGYLAVESGRAGISGHGTRELYTSDQRPRRLASRGRLTRRQLRAHSPPALGLPGADAHLTLNRNNNEFDSLTPITDGISTISELRLRK